MTITFITAQMRRRDGQKWPQPFAARANQMFGQVRDHTDRALHAGADDFVHSFHVICGEFQQMLDGRWVALYLYFVWPS